MDLSLFKRKDPSGKLAKEKYVSKNHNEEYEFIMKYCNSLGIKDLKFKEKVYICLNGLKSVPKCKNPKCDKLVKFRNTTLGYREYCSNKCISSDPNVKKLKEIKSLEKYGTKTPAESNFIKEKIIKTNKEKYGGNSPMSNKNTQEKSKKTLLKNYGVENPSKSKKILDKRVESFKENIDGFKESYRKSSLEKYGVEHPWMDKNIHLKSVDSSYESRKERTRTVILEKLSNYPNYRLVEINYTKSEKNSMIECPLGHIFEINRINLYERNLRKTEICTICNPISHGTSGMEKQLLNLIKSNYNGEILENSRSIISPYELDIYLPEKKLAIEFNGLFWHSSSNRSSDYHLKKYKMCESLGINLLVIWEDDWVLNREICESFVLNKLGKSKKIYARKCEIKEISSEDSKLFLNENHFQGNYNSSIRIGLFYENKLVSLMTFSKLRISLNSRGGDNDYELNRFCNLKGNLVVGGASKILKYFINNYNPEKIETYSDNLISNGDLYQKLGFDYKHTSRPGYWYLISGKKEHRYNWRKSKLVEMGADPNKTEEEIMMEWGYYRIYNAGNKKWVLEF